MTKRPASLPRKLFVFALKVAFVVALFLVIFRPETFGLRKDLFQNITPRSLLDVLAQVQTGPAVFWLTFAVVMKLFGILAGVLRWRLLLRAQGLPIPFWYLVKCWFMGRAIGLFLPGTIGLDGYRLVESSRYTGEVVKCTSVIIVEKLIGFVVLFSLVFITLPIGFKLFEFKLPLLAAVLSVLAVFIVSAFLLLLNPKAVQVLVAIFPTPRVIRNKVDEFGTAIAAFSGRRGILLLAVLLGFGVHLGICLMYFGTVSAVRAANTSFWDVLFASALVTVASIIGPTVSGAGIREAGFGFVLKSKAGAASGVLAGHLGLWAGEIIPFVLSLPLLLFTTRPSKEELVGEMDALRREGAAVVEHIQLTREQVRAYRGKIVNALLAGFFGGLIAGALVGLAEAVWFVLHLSGLADLQALWWGPLVYGLVFSGLGIAIGFALAFVYLLLDRFAAPTLTFAVSLGLALTAGGTIIGGFRFGRDVLHDRAMTLQQHLGLLAMAAAAGLIVAVVAGIITALVRTKRVGAVIAGLLAFGLLVGAGAAYATFAASGPAQPAFSPQQTARPDAPNIVLIVSDALRADYLPLYNTHAGIATPTLDALAKDGTLFRHGFSEASWTKPSFGTIFSGVYPEEHTATGKTSMLPDQVTTIAEALRSAGYYTKGFSNNPNIATLFNFNQGFVDYTDLKPSLYFGADESSAKLTLYQVLRKVRQIIEAKLFHGYMSVTDFYQPADSVAKVATQWLDNRPVPQGTPFFLFVHFMDTHDPFMDHKHPGVGYARARNESPDPDLAGPMAEAYREEIQYMDHYLGDIIADLKQRGLYDNTLLFFTGDHGEEFYDHEGWWHGKTLYDEVTHVPFIIKFPHGQHAGEVNDQFIRHLDIAPTAAQFAGATLSPSWRGQPVLDAAGNFTNGSIDFVYSHNDFENNVLRAVRTDSCKVIHANPDNPRGLAPDEVYDLKADPKEKDNLAGKGTDCESKVGPMIDSMKAFTNEGAAEPKLEQSIPEGAREQLESLGYL